MKLKTIVFATLLSLGGCVVSPMDRTYPVAAYPNYYYRPVPNYEYGHSAYIAPNYYARPRVYNYPSFRRDFYRRSW